MRRIKEIKDKIKTAGMEIIDISGRITRLEKLHGNLSARNNSVRKRVDEIQKRLALAGVRISVIEGWKKEFLTATEDILKLRGEIKEDMNDIRKWEDNHVHLPVVFKDALNLNAADLLAIKDMVDSALSSRVEATENCCTYMDKLFDQGVCTRVNVNQVGFNLCPSGDLGRKVSIKMVMDVCPFCGRSFSFEKSEELFEANG